MIKKIKSLATLIVIATIGFSVQTANSKPINSTILASQEIKNFSGLVAGGPIEVVVKLGNTEGIRFEGDEDAIASLIAEVKGNVLIIRPQISWMSWERKYQGKKITAYVNAKELNNVTMSGSGNMTIIGEVKNDEFSVNLSGSGSLKVTATAQKLNARLSGSGGLNISGNSDEVRVLISGSAKFNGKNYKTDDLSAKISGSGAVYIHVNDRIGALISGSGGVYYSGNPDVDKKILGSGVVKKI
jgi:hypothetical protein